MLHNFYQQTEWMPTQLTSDSLVRPTSNVLEHCVDPVKDSNSAIRVDEMPGFRLHGYLA